MRILAVAVVLASLIFVSRAVEDPTEKLAGVSDLTYVLTFYYLPNECMLRENTFSTHIIPMPFAVQQLSTK